MILYVFWGLSVLSTIVYSIRHPKRLGNQKLILVLLFAFLLIILGWARGAYDVEIGISRYINYERMESFTEVGFNLLVRIFHALGFDYRKFYIFCSLIELLSMFWFTKKNCKKSHIAICLFLIYPFVIFFQYLRTLIAIPFLLVALDCLINREEKYVIKYVVFCLVAATFHLSSLFFLLYLPASFVNKKALSIATLTGVIVVQMSGSIGFLYNLVNNYLGSEKVGILERSVSANGTFGRIAGMAISILFFYLIVFVLKYIYKIQMDQYKDELYWKINLLSFLCIPLVLNFGVGFSRVPTLLYLFNYPYLVSKISDVLSQKKRLLVYCLVVLYLCGMLYISYHNIEYRKLVLYPFFEQNELIEFLFG